MFDDNLVLADAITHSHCVVGDHSEGGDESCQDMKHAFLLHEACQ